MMFTKTALLLVLDLSSTMASRQHLRARQLNVTNSTDAANSTVSLAPAPTLSPAPTSYEPTTWEPTTWEPTTWEPSTYQPTSNSTANSTANSTGVIYEPNTAHAYNQTSDEPSESPTYVPTAAPTSWDCPEDILVPIGTWDDYSWDELPACVQKAAAVFGYNKSKWNNGKESCPDFCDKWWKNLSSKQKRAARTFGYNKGRWD